MEKGFFVTDDGMVAVQGMITIGEAKSAAERLFTDLPFGEIGRFEILHFDGVASTKTHLRWEPVVDWEPVR